jgi:methyl-accepting chemotaxis protein
MNKARRTAITAEVAKARDLLAQLSRCATALETLKDQEQECYDNMPMSLQESDGGEKILDTATMLEQCVADMDGAINEITSSMDEIEEVVAA